MSVEKMNHAALSAMRLALRRRRMADKALWASFFVSLGFHAAVAVAVSHYGADRQAQFFILLEQGEEALEMEIGGAVDSAASLPQTPPEMREKRFDSEKPIAPAANRPRETVEPEREAAVAFQAETVRREAVEFEDARSEPPVRSRPERTAAARSKTQPGAVGAPVAMASREGAERRTRGVRQRPQVISSLAFVYPGGSRRRGETGTVVIRASIDAAGGCVSARVEHSSGYRDLDAEAVNTIRRARFQPARVDGAPVAMTDRFVIEFQLR